MLQTSPANTPPAIQPGFTVQELINRHPFSRYQWLIFFLCFVIVLLDGFDTAAIGFLAPSLQTEWHITRQALAPVLTAALIGLSVGSLLAGPVADRYGRKLIIWVSVLLFGVACTASSFATTLEQLVLMRLITGLGLGAALPNAVTLLSEFCPDRRRATLTNALFCGFPLGAALGGFVAAWMIPLWGWRSVLLAGGLVPLLLVIPILTLLPESLRYMVARRKSGAVISDVLRKISSGAIQVSDLTLNEEILQSKKNGLALIFSRHYMIATLMLWLTYFMGLVIFYSLINWLPILLNDIAIAPKSASMIASLFPLGGVGAVFFGWLMDRYNANIIIACGYAATAVLLFTIGQAAGNSFYLILFVFLGGAIMNTSQVSLAALAAACYPTEARVTGVAWMLGVGRFGGVAGSFFIAELMRRQVDFKGIFSCLAVSGLIAAAALLIKQFAEPGKSAPLSQ